MTQGTRVGTFVEPCKNSLQNLLQSSFCLLLFSPYLSQESTCERWRTKKETIRARAAPQTSRPSLRAVWLLRCPIATMADIPTPSKLFYSAINTLVFPRLCYSITNSQVASRNKFLLRRKMILPYLRYDSDDWGDESTA